MLATNVSYVPAIVFGIAMLCVILYGFIPFFCRKHRLEKVLGAFIICLGITGLIITLMNPSVKTYDAIITDWNEVYEQGYEVIETNGKIVTLRKVDE